MHTMPPFVLAELVASIDTWSQLHPIVALLAAASATALLIGAIHACFTFAHALAERRAATLARQRAERAEVYRRHAAMELKIVAGRLYRDEDRLDRRA